MELDDAIIGALVGDTTLIAYLADGASGVGHGIMPDGTKAPYIEVLDAGDVPTYTFTNSEAYSDAQYIIRVFTQDTVQGSAQRNATTIINRIFAVLQNRALTVSGRNTLGLKRGARIPSGWETINDQERYYRDGHKWLVTTGPA